MFSPGAQSHHIHNAPSALRLSCNMLNCFAWYHHGNWQASDLRTEEGTIGAHAGAAAGGQWLWLPSAPRALQELSPPGALAQVQHIRRVAALQIGPGRCEHGGLLLPSEPQTADKPHTAHATVPLDRRPVQNGALHVA